MTGGQRARHSVRAGTLLGVVALGVPLVWGSQAPPVELPFMDGLAWLGNSSTGEVVQVNGQTGTVQARLGGLDGEMTVAQTSEAVLVQVDGEVRQIDPDSLEWGQSLEADGELVVGEDDDGAPVAYLVHPDQRVLTLDPLTLAVTAEVDLAGTPQVGVVAPDGELVLPVRTSEGVVIEVVDGDRSSGSAPVGDGGDRVQLSRVGDSVLALNVTAHDLHTLDLSEAVPQVATTAALDLPSGQVLVPGELPEGPLWLLAPRDGDLFAVDTERGEVDGVVSIADPGSDLLGPVVQNDVVYVLNRSLGELVLVDTETLEPISAPYKLSDYGLSTDDETELLAQEGSVFVNDPDGDITVVFSDGQAPMVVDKTADSDGGETEEVDTELASEQSADPRAGEEDQPRQAGDDRPVTDAEGSGPSEPGPPVGVDALGDAESFGEPTELVTVTAFTRHWFCLLSVPAALPVPFNCL